MGTTLLRSLVTYPATLMVAIAAVYVVARVEPGHRGSTFVMLSMSAIGATEAFLVATSFIRRARLIVVAGQALMGVGALMIGYAALRGAPSVWSILGSLVFAAAAVVKARVASQAR